MRLSKNVPWTIFQIIIGLHLASNVKTAKILSILSFIDVGRISIVPVLLNALESRGHNITIVSSVPYELLLNENIRQVNISANVNMFQDFINFMFGKWNGDLFEKLLSFFTKGPQMCENVMLDATFQEILQKESFDLLIVDVFMTESLFGLGEYFKAPMVGLSNMRTVSVIDKLVGNTSPTSYIPNMLLEHYYDMTFVHRFLNVALNSIQMITHNMKYLPQQEQLYQQYFPQAKLSFDQANRNFSLVLLNQHVTLSFARPYVPNMIEVAGLHIPSEVAALPLEVQQFLDESLVRVIYISLDASVQKVVLRPEHYHSFREAFRKLSYRIVWNTNNDTFIQNDKEAANILYVPSSINHFSILAHSKVQLFITSCKFLSIIEAVYYATPILGLPLFNDQFRNMEMAAASGYGLSLKLKSLDEQIIIRYITELMTNPKYAQTIQGYSQRFRDQPMRPLDKAIYWIEYVLRHQGAPHLAINGRYLSFVQYFNIDVLIAMAFLLVLVILAAFIIVKIIFVALLFGSRKRKLRNGPLPIKLKAN